jgi:hypothetical protein
MFISCPKNVLYIRHTATFIKQCPQAPKTGTRQHALGPKARLHALFLGAQQHSRVLELRHWHKTNELGPKARLRAWFLGAQQHSGVLELRH